MNLLRPNVLKDVSASDLPISIVAPADRLKPTRWGLILVVFMRLMAALWLFQGLLEWASVLLPAETVVDSLSGGAVAVIVFFAIADLVAAVGLWLATPWGGALWLFAALSQIFASVTVKDAFGPGWVVVDVLLIVLYLGLTFKAGQAQN